MIKASLPSNETARLNALRTLAILDTPPEERFDRITRLASRLFEVPIVLVSLVDANRQWFKACYGLDSSETGRDISFCGHAILSDNILVIPDAREDERFWDNPLVTGDPFVRFYAGYPLSGPTGHKLGTLCLLDTKPRQFTQADREALTDLAKLVEKELGSADMEQSVRIIRESEVTTRKLAEDLAMQKDLTTHLFEQCAVPVIGLNLQHEVILWNKAAEELTGFRASELLDTTDQWRPFYDHPRPILGDMIIDQAYDQMKTLYGQFAYKASEATGALYAEGWFTRINGKARYLQNDSRPVYDKDGKLIAAITTMLDVTEQKQTDEALKAQRDFGQQIMNNMAQGLIVTDSTGYYEYVNPAYAQMVGYSLDQLAGETMQQVVYDEDASNLAALWQRQVAGETVHHETQLRKADGVPLDVLLTAAPRYEDGKVTGSISVITDLTERKRIERLKSEFISTVSHELRTPLTSIRGSLGLVMGGVAGEVPPMALSMVEIAHKNSERLVRLINDILDVEKIESGKMVFHLKPLELLPLIEQSLEANQGYAEQFKVNLQLNQVGPKLAEARSNLDSDRFNQVLTNLVSNAVKFSPAGGTVEISMTEKGALIHLAVTDHGPGIPTDFQDRIFQKFMQADSSSTRQQGGTGLGLNISKAIVERMNGRIGFDTVVGQGTTFWVELPRWHDGSEELVTPVSKPLPPRLLICEDNVDINSLLGMILEETGLEIDSAYTVQEARELLQQHEGEYVAMTLDLMLPDQDGISFIRELRENLPTAHLPIIVVSAKAEAGQSEINGNAVAVVDWIDKPIDHKRLLSAVEQVYQGSQNRPRILHLEDDPDIIKVVAGILHEVADVVPANTMQQARQIIKQQQFDLILVDLGLPDGNGMDILAYMSQQSSSHTPVVVFSAHEVSREAVDQVSAALVKSRTSNQELVATIRNLIDPASLTVHATQTGNK